MYYVKEKCLMKTTVIIRANEVAYINDLLGTYGSEKRVKEICKVTHGITVFGMFTKERTYLLTVEVPMLLGLGKIAMDHAKPIKGLVKTISGIRDTIEYLGRNISRDIRNLMREYEEKE